MKILFIDESVYFNKYLTKYLEEEFGPVTQAQNVEGAVKEITSGRKYDLIISELILPWGMDGKKYVDGQPCFDEYSWPLPQDLAGLNIYTFYTKKHLPEAKTIFVSVCDIKPEFHKFGVPIILKPEYPEKILEEIKKLFATAE